MYFALILALTTLADAIEFSEIGISAQLTNNHIIEANKWTTLVGWTVSKNPGFFSYGVLPNSEVKLPISGIYFLSTNVIFSQSSQWNLTTCFQNTRTDVVLSCSTKNGQSLFGNERSLTLTRFVLLEQEDSLEILVYSNGSQEAKAGSVLSIQYMGSLASSPGISLFVSREVKLQKKTKRLYYTLDTWIEKKELGTFNNLQGWDSSKGIFRVICDGVYSLSIEITLQADPGTYELHVVLDQSTILARSIRTYDTKSKDTLSLYGIYHLKKGNVVHFLILSDVKGVASVTKLSHLCLVYIGKQFNSNSEFSVRVNNTKFRASSLWLSMKYFLPKKVGQPELLDEKDISVYAGDKLTVGRSGIYFIFFQAELQLEPGDTVSMLVSLGKSARFARMVDGLSSSVVNNINRRNRVSLSFSSMHELQSKQYFSFLLRSTKRKIFTILRPTWISVVRIRLSGFVAAATLGNTHHGSMIYEPRNEWRHVKPWLTATSNVFGFNSAFNSSDGAFTCPLRGVYMFVLNLMMRSVMTDEASMDLSLLITTNEGKVKEDLKISKFIRKDLDVTSLSTTLSLQESDIVHIGVKPNRTISLSRLTTVYIVFLDFLESTGTYIALANTTYLSSEQLHVKNSMSWIPVTLNSQMTGMDNSAVNSVLVPGDGIYLIMFDVIIEVNQTSRASSKEVSFLIETEGLSDRRSISDKATLSSNAMLQNVSLSSAGVMKLYKGKQIHPMLILEERVDGISVTSGRLTCLLISSSRDESQREAFRMIRLTHKMFNFRGSQWYPVNDVDFPSNTGSFKSPAVTLNGPHILATQPMFVFVSTSVEFQRVKGKFELQFRVLPRKDNTRHQLHSVVVAQTASNIVLKLSGVTFLEQGESLELVVRSSKGDLIIRSRSALSLIALHVPFRKPQLYKKSVDPHLNLVHLQPRTSSRKVKVTESGVYLVLRCCSPSAKKNTGLSRPQTFLIEHFTTNQELHGANFSSPSSAFLLHKNHNTFVQFKLSSQFPLQGREFSLDPLFGKRLNRLQETIFNLYTASYCKIFLVSVSIFIMSEARTISLILRTNDGEQDIASSVKKNSLHNLAFYGTLCFRQSPAFILKIGNSDVNIQCYLLQGSQISMAFVESSQNVLGFSSFYNKTASQVHTRKGLQRLDGFVINNTLTYDSTSYFRPPSSGIYIKRAGKYFITINLIVEARQKSSRGLKLEVWKDKVTIPELIIDVSAEDLSADEKISLTRATILNLKQSHFLEVMANMETDEVEISSGTTFSMLMLESEASVENCPGPGIKLRPLMNRDVVLKEHVNFTATCFLEGESVADIEWVKDDKIVMFSPGVTNSTLEILDTATDDSGSFICIARKGDMFATSRELKLAVYDPVPVMTPSNGTFEVHENGRINDIVFQFSVKAAKHSHDELAEVDLSIVQGDPDGNFRIYPNRTRSSASLLAHKLLDFEVATNYNLTIRATNADFNGTAEKDFYFSISVLDMNDNRPQFDKIFHNVTITEDTSIGTLVYTLKAYDKDSESNGRISYRLLHNGNSKFFSLNNETGEIFVKNKLDREVQDIHTLLVIATDLRFKSFAEVVVHVQDVNDNFPKFKETDVTLVLTEATLQDTTLLRVEATDPDLGKYGEVTYYIEDSKIKNNFVIDQYGNLKTLHPLEKFAGEILHIVIQAVDGGGLKSKDKFVATLNVSPITYFKSPKFDQSLYTVRVPENKPKGTEILNVKASFKLQGSDFKYNIIYRLKRDDEDLLTVQQASGKIFLSTELDYEKEKVHKVTILACDKYASLRCSEGVIEIIVVDVNDNMPTFLNPVVNFTLSESTSPGTVIFKAVAMDNDGPSNSKISYKILTNDHDNSFVIDEVTGDVVLAKEIDFEQSREYVLVISAVDSGTPSLSGTCMINVLVSDENEHAPVFNQTEYRVSVTENNIQDVVIATVLATDRDHDAKLTYEINCREDVECQSCFRIDMDTGIITAVCTFDREKRDQYVFLVEAKDFGKYPLKATAYFTLDIDDINDVIPHLEDRYIVLNVSLSTLPNSYIYRVKAVDYDKGKNGELGFKFTENSEYFGILSNGVVHLKKDLSYELRDKTVELKIVAFDHGKPSLSSKEYTTLIINIMGTFVSNFPGYEYLPISVNENASVGQVIGQVQKGVLCCSMNYTLQGSTALNYFGVDLQNGTIFIKKGLDFETINSFTFTVFGKSQGKIVYKGLLKINVLDVDEKIIYFSTSRRFVSITESTHVGAIIGRFAVQYNGYAREPNLRYTLTDTSNHPSASTFKVNPDGILTLVKSLDYESKREYYIKLLVCDQFFPNISATLKLIIAVEDENDNNPVFEKTPVYYEIPENKIAGEKVISIKAKDADSGKNGEITYSLISCIPVVDFEINAKSGEIFVKNDLDFERTREYRLHIQAKDSGHSPRYSVKYFRIVIKDINDNMPEFLFTSMEAYVKAESAVGSKVGKVKAEDKDSGENGRVGYVMSDVLQTRIPFSLDFVSGSIIQQDVLENVTNYTFTISAYDNGVPKLKSVNDMNFVVHIFKDDPTSVLRCVVNDLTSTSIELKFDVGSYFGIKARGINRIAFIAQEYHPDDAEYSAYSQLPPVTWYDINYKRNRKKTYLRRYLCGSYGISFQRKRVTRDINDDQAMEALFKFGVEEDCSDASRIGSVCNGPLLPGNSYRFQLEVFFGKLNDSVTTAFTSPYRTETPWKAAAHKGPSDVVYYSLGLLGFCVSIIVVLIAVLCYIYWRRKNTRKYRREAGIQKDEKEDSESDELDFLKRCNGTELQEIAVYFGSSSSSSLYETTNSFTNHRLIPKQKVMIQSNC